MTTINTKYCKNCKVEFTQYPDGQTAILLTAENGELAAKATVNMAQTQDPLPENEVYLKGWSENEGIPEALEFFNILQLTGKTVKAGHAFAQHAVLLK